MTHYHWFCEHRQARDICGVQEMQLRRWTDAGIIVPNGGGSSGIRRMFSVWDCVEIHVCLGLYSLNMSEPGMRRVLEHIRIADRSKRFDLEGGAHGCTLVIPLPEIVNTVETKVGEKVCEVCGQSRAGVLKPNKGRQMRNLPPVVEGGDTPYLAQQNYSLGGEERR